MNNVNLIGRLTKDPVIIESGDTLIAKYTLAVNRDADKADFIRCICFNGGAEFVEKHLAKGMKVGVTGRIQTGSYENADGVTIYTTDVVVSSHTFCEPRREAKGDGEDEHKSKSGYKRKYK